MQARVFRAEQVNWIEPPGHRSSFSKMLINPENSDTKYFDFRVSITYPYGQIDAHKHEVAENIYYVLQGNGIIELDGERELVSPGFVIFIPPGVVHALYNTGFENLITVVVAGPAHDMPR